VNLLGICLAGPTASGKSALALQLADALRGEIDIEFISVDSAQIYRGMDIGTAKPDAAERALVPHHLIDILDPEQAYSAAQFVRDATAAAADIRARGRLPLLVGGTMLYFKALRDGLDAMPAADPALRSQLDARAAAEGWPALHAELQRVDPATAARLAPNDTQRIQRALEMWMSSGQPLSAFHACSAARPDAGRWPLIALEPDSRAWLHERIARRFDAMLAAGFVDEVRLLRQRPALQP
jgi:tRNA dimethylallyltransferase